MSNGEFARFFKTWEEQHKIYMQRLESESLSLSLSCKDGTEQVSLVQHVLDHFQEYYDEKSKAAESDVFLMFSPPWFSSYERALLWVAGFKPSVAFPLVKMSVGSDLDLEQEERIAVMREETRRAEKEIAQAMASMQESVAVTAPTLENAVGELKVGLLGVMRDADGLRQRTGLRVLEVLNPGQKVKFLTRASQFWLQSRTFGMERDARLKKQ